MAKIHGVAGEWARVKGTVAGLWPLFLGVYAAGAATALAAIAPAWGGPLLVAVMLFIIWRLMAGMRRIESFFKGARGEEKVSGILENLPDAYHVFNDFTVGNYHVDHVVAGPGGVFAIETKFWNGKVTVEDGYVLLDGRLPDRSPLAQALREATLVRNALSAAGWSGAVTPVLVFASDSFTAHRANVKGVVIINSSEIKASFGTDRVVVTPAELDRLVGIMEGNS
ncbi:MAG: NERD domain-containing protein [Kiritimatiellae bacterium]|nr:NERD domain-containing protein [Kiritimatiellia bacterium]